MLARFDTPPGLLEASCAWLWLGALVVAAAAYRCEFRSLVVRPIAINVMQVGRGLATVHAASTTRGHDLRTDSAPWLRPVERTLTWFASVVLLTPLLASVRRAAALPSRTERV